ncbi:MAG: hypothetical protein WCC93_10120 [Chthoniobacterales bacterium]
MFTDDPGDRMPVYGIANYGAIDSGLSDSGPTLVTVVGLDRFDNWSGLTEQEEKDRRVPSRRRLIKIIRDSALP